MTILPSLLFIIETSFHCCLITFIEHTTGNHNQSSLCTNSFICAPAIKCTSSCRAHNRVLKSRSKSPPYQFCHLCSWFHCFIITFKEHTTGNHNQNSLCINSFICAPAIECTSSRRAHNMVLKSRSKSPPYQFCHLCSCHRVHQFS